MSRLSVVLDACALVPIRLATTLLWLAEADLFTPLWSEAILDEVQRNLPRVSGISTAAAERRVSAMRNGFGSESLVDSYSHLLGSMRCDPKDRHVLAAAVAAGADALVTFNLRDFPGQSVQEHGVQLLHPEQFLMQLLVERPQEVAAALEREAAALRRPPESLREFLSSLTRIAPTFANVAAFTAEHREEPSPVPALVEAPTEEVLAAFGDAGDITRPEQILLAWWSSLIHDDLASTQAFTASPEAFGDYRWAREYLSGRALASGVLWAVDAPDDIAFMRFVPESPTSVRVFASSMVPSVVATLVRLEDDTWRVWGLGNAMVSAADVFGQA